MKQYTPGSIGRQRDSLDDSWEIFPSQIQRSGLKWTKKNVNYEIDDDCSGDGQMCCTANSCPMKRRRRSRYWLYNSMSLCPAPSTQRGSTALGQRSNRVRPWEKSITSSSVPWMMSTGDVILETFSMLKEGKTKKEIRKERMSDFRDWSALPTSIKELRKQTAQVKSLAM